MGKVCDIEYVWMNIVIFQFFCIFQPGKGYLSLKIVTFVDCGSTLQQVPVMHKNRWSTSKSNALQEPMFAEQQVKA